MILGLLRIAIFFGLLLALIAAPVHYHHHSRIHRSAAARHEFEREHPCPSTGLRTGSCPGYIIDHIKPLACGGPDKPSNLQWQTVEAAKAKDKWERKGCGK